MQKEKIDTAASTVKIHYDLLLHYINRHSATVNDFICFTYQISYIYQG